MTKILITGGSGFIGSHVAEHFQNKADIVVYDNLSSGNKNNIINLKHSFIEGSILDKELLNEAMNDVDYVIHLAAIVSVQESMTDPYKTIETNVKGLINVLEAAAAHNVKKLIFASSCSIYGECPILPKTETLLPDPRSPYAISKLDGEYYCNLYKQTKNLNYTALRFFNVYGARQDPSNNYAAVIPIFLHNAMQNTGQNKPITIYGDGTQTRDFVYVKDVVSAIDFAITNSNISGVFNVGSETSISILEVAKTIKTLTNSKSEIVFKPSRAGDVQHSKSNCSKLKEEGWFPKYGFLTGLQEIIKTIPN